MKSYFYLLAGVFLFASAVFLKFHRFEFILFVSVACGFAALAEMPATWNRKITRENFSNVIFRMRNPISFLGKFFGAISSILLIAYFAGTSLGFKLS